MPLLKTASAWSFFDGGGTVPPAATSLPRAIAARWDAVDTLGSAFPGGLWRDLAPPGTAYPHAVFSILGTVTDYMTSTPAPSTSEGQVTITAYAATGDEADALAEVLLAAFNDAAMPLAGRDLMLFRRATYPQGSIATKGEGSADVWQNVSAFDFMIGSN